jgi:DNA-binding CsgD family transcriptional regulator
VVAVVGADEHDGRRHDQARVGAPLATGVAALTPSERRIATLAAEGRSNREIAQALFLTVKTVETHLSNAYRKLDIRSRRELPEALSDTVEPARAGRTPAGGHGRPPYAISER